MDYDDLLEMVKKRRSIKKFKPDPIPDEYVNKIIEVARWSPSGINSQPWEFVVIKKQEIKDRIRELITEHIAPLPETEWVHYPVFILLCGDIRTCDAYPLKTVQRERETFLSSLANAMLYMMLAISTLGLGGRWVSATGSPSVESHIKELLGIPKEMEIFDMLVMGYPDMEPIPRWVRDQDEMVHYDCYDKTKYRTDKDIKEFIADLRRASRIRRQKY